MNGEALGSLNDIDPNYPTPRVYEFLSRPDNSAFLEYVFNDPFGCHVFPRRYSRLSAVLFFSPTWIATINRPSRSTCGPIFPPARYRCHFCQYRRLS